MPSAPPSGARADSARASGRGITFRAVVIGLLLAPLNCYWVQQMEIVWYAGHPTSIALYFNVVFTLLVMLAANWLLSKLRPAWALQHSEFLVVYVILAIACSLAGHDQLQILVPAMGWSTWYATPENRWEELFSRFTPKYLVVQDETALRGFFEGNSTLYTRPHLLAWAVPVAVWSGFILTLILAMLCINAILRRQWTEHEKLSYPIVQIPLDITDPRFDLWRSKLFWAAFAMAAGLDTINGLGFLYPAIPMFEVRALNVGRFFTGWPWYALQGARGGIYPFAIGLGYLLPLDLLFSCWFFYWFWHAQRVATLAMAWEGDPRFPYVPEQSFGGYIGLILFSLWVARRYLARVFRCAFIRSSDLEDEREPIGYRWAVWGLILALVAIIAFTRYAGMPVWIACAFFAIYFLLSLAITRMRAELGPPAHDLHAAGPDVILTNVFGSQALGPRAVTMFSLYYWMNRAYRSHPMPHQLEAFKIAEQRNLGQRRMFAVLVAAAVVGIICAFWGMIHIGYAYGMGTANVGLAAAAFGREPWQRLGAWLTEPVKPSSGAGTATLIGIAFSILLLTVRMRWIWWPFHPVGYAVSSSWSMNLLWMPLFIAWVIKLFLLRYGGLRLYRQALPFFLGLILGEHAAGGAWSLIGIALKTKTYVFWAY
ncbi:MAG: hypothetical protein JSV65_16100 [Armatimonadota bacterium]|nr:MAG: hypothetical protein JSV65_16100 [Armatimonadota bacterium]